MQAAQLSAVGLRTRLVCGRQSCGDSLPLLCLCRKLLPITWAELDPAVATGQVALKSLNTLSLHLCINEMDIEILPSSYRVARRDT